MKAGSRVALDMTTLTIMRHLPREVDPLVYNMSHEDLDVITYSVIGGLAEQIRELREASMLAESDSLYQFINTSQLKAKAVLSVQYKISVFFLLKYFLSRYQYEVKEIRIISRD